jgi:hypothetical protein
MFIHLAVAWGVVMIALESLNAQQPINERQERDKAIEWIKRNNKWGIDHSIVNDMTAHIDEQTKDGYNINLFFGKGLLNKDKFQSIHLWSGQFFQFAMTDQQAETMEIGPMAVQTSTGKRQDKRAATPLFEVSELRFKDSHRGSIAGDQKLNGSLKIRAIGSTNDKDSYAIRFGYRGETNVMRFFYLDDHKIAKEGTTIDFNFAPIHEDAKEKPHVGALPVFCDICTVKESSGELDIQLLSNSVAALLDVKGQQ